MSCQNGCDGGILMGSYGCAFNVCACEQGERILAVLRAIGRGEPVGLRGAFAAKDAQDYDASCHALIEPGHKETAEERQQRRNPTPPRVVPSELRQPTAEGETMADIVAPLFADFFEDSAGDVKPPVGFKKEDSK